MSGPGRGGEVRRVVVTGAGAVTPLGPDLPTTWLRLVAGESGIRPISAFDPSRVESRVAGEARDADPARVLDRKSIRRTDRTTQLALLATSEALASAGLPGRLEGELADRTGAYIGSGFGGARTIFDEIRTYVERGPDRLSPFFVPMAIANLAAGQVGIAFGARGPNLATVSACASGGHAIGEATETILRGDADVMLAGGAEAPVIEGIVGAFAAMKALSTRNDDPAGASRPFDAGRDGFIVAEGAGTLVLEEVGHARARGAVPLAEVVGYGASADAYHVTLPGQGGEGGVRAARRALEKAGCEPSAIDLVSAHATSTPEGDRAELLALRALFGGGDDGSWAQAPGAAGHAGGAASAVRPNAERGAAGAARAAASEAQPNAGRGAAREIGRVVVESGHATGPLVTATKGALGHTLGAAGAIGAALAVRSLVDGVVPPTLNLFDPDPDAHGLNIVAGSARRGTFRLALVNAFGFGGQNSTLLLRRWEDA